MSQSQFISRLMKRQRETVRDMSSGKEMPFLRDNIRIMIADTDEGCIIRIVDKNLNNIPHLDANNYNGNLRRLLKSITEIQDLRDNRFEWGVSGNRNHELLTNDYPYLVPLCMACRELLVDNNGKKLEIKEEPARIILQLSEIKSKNKPSKITGKFFVDNLQVKSFISEQYVLVENGVIQHIHSVGERFNDLMVFTEDIEHDLITLFLSLLYSTSNNIIINYGNRKVEKKEVEIPVVPTIIFDKIDSDNALHLRVSGTLDDMPATLFSDFDVRYIARVDDNLITVIPVKNIDLTAEMEYLSHEITSNSQSKVKAREVWRDNNLFVIPPAIASTFLFGCLPVLVNRYKLMGTEKLSAYKITPARPKLNLKLGSGINFLEGEASINIGEEKFTINQLLAQYRKNRYITLKDGNRAVLDSKYMKRLERIFGDTHGSKNTAVKLSFFDLPEAMDLIEDNLKVEPKAFKAYRDFFEGFNKISTTRVATPGLKAKLRNYQKAGLQWIKYLYDENMGGCLADDMGLGKTVQTIAMLCNVVKKSTAPILIVMPRSLLFNWEQEFAKFAPHITIATYYNAGRNIETASKSQVILTTYAMVRNDIEKFLNYEFEYIILDESQNIKNVDAQITKAVWLLKGRHKLALSGTPIENNLTELYSLFHFLNPTMFGTLANFNELYTNPIQRDNDTDTAQALRRKIFPFMLRRLKKNVLTDLPDRMEQTLMVEMSPEQARLYEDRRRYYSALIEGTLNSGKSENLQFELLRALGELRQIASIPEEKSDGHISSPKIELLTTNIIQAIEGGHKVVAFFNFLAGIELTGEALSRAGIKYEVMTGATTDRRKVISEFQDNPDCRVLLMTVKTGGVGLNLVVADTVFVVEPWWNKAAEEQAINRLHRIGQKNAVNCYYMLTEDTIEEKIRKLQEKKSALVDAIISSDSNLGKQLSIEDINYLLG